MIKNKKKISHRLVSLLALILIFTTLTVSMASCSKKYDEIEDGQTVEQYVAQILSSTEEYKFRFIAASRGHDMSKYYSTNKAEKAEFVDSSEIKDPDVEVAKKVLEDILEGNNFKRKTTSKQKVQEFKDSLTAEQVTKVAELLQTTVQFNNDGGILSWILIGIGKALGWITGLVGNYYVIAILIFAVLVEILMIPVAIKQQKNAIGSAMLRPKIAKIEKKYAGRTDQATLRKKQEEIMQLQQQEGYSPFSGCLPLILQLVIVGFILYPIIQNPIYYMLGTSQQFSSTLLSYATAPKVVGGLGLTLAGKGNVIELISILNADNIGGLEKFALISNGKACLAMFNSLTMPDLTMFTINLAPIPTLTFKWPAIILLLVPALNVAGTILSMKLNKKWSVNQQYATASADAQTNASMKIMEWIGPAMTLFIMFQVPALIGVYWFFRSLLAILKQYILKVTMPVPKYTEEELREMEKAEKEIKKAQKEASKTTTKHRSLHYIDDDDYDILPEAPKSEENKSGESFSGDMPEIKD